MKKVLILGVAIGLVSMADASNSRYEGSYSNKSSSSYYNQGGSASQNTNSGPAMIKQNGFSANFNQSDIQMKDRVATRGDVQLQKQIRNTLNSQFGPEQVQFLALELNNGRVVLIGSVATMRDSQAIEDTIAGINGVQSVSNRLTIAGGEGAQTQPSAFASSNLNNSQFAQQIQSSLANMGHNNALSTINITANGGIVTLTGKVANRNIKSGIERAIYGMNGVTDVNNYLTVDSSLGGYSNQGPASAYGNSYGSGSGLNDSELLNKVNSKLKSGWFTTSFKNVDVTVNNGVVTLNGTVRSAKLKSNAEQAVQGIDGVQNVINNLNITR